MIEKYNDQCVSHRTDWRRFVRHFWRTMAPDAPFSALVSYLKLDSHTVAAMCDTTERTVRRWGDAPPAYVPPLLLALSGFVLADAFEGWRVIHGGLVHPSAPSTKHKPINAGFLSDFAQAMQSGRHASNMLRDLVAENDKLRAMLHRADLVTRLPLNVRLFPGVKIESVVSK